MKTKAKNDNDKNVIKIKCEFCAHVEILNGLSAWSAVILTYL